MDRPRARRWTDQDIAALLHMRDLQHLSWKTIDTKLNRSKGGAQLKYGSIKSARTEREMRSGRKHAGVGRIEPTADQLQARAARAAAIARMTQAAVFLGDPPPGYSALDRRGQ